MGQQINDNRGCPVENRLRRKKKPEVVVGDPEGYKACLSQTERC